MALPREESTYSEVVVVVLAAFGNPIIASLYVVFGGEAASNFTVLTHDKLMGMIIYELIMLLFIAWFLRFRGWGIEEFNLGFGWRLTGEAIGLAIGAVLIGYAFYYILIVTGANLEKGVLRYDPENWSILSAIGLSIINPIFEETIVVGYLMGVFMKPDSPTMAFNTSIGIRLIYHLYQGAAGVVFIIPMGMLFSYYYIKRCKLYPIILAHGIMDITPFIYTWCLTTG